MGVSAVDKRRAVQILEKLREHGPLSTAALEEVLVPKISRRRLLDATARLVKNDLVISLDGSYAKNGSKVFELKRSERAKQIIAKKLNLNLEELEYCYVRQWEQRHGELCARWAEFFKRRYPNATVTKDWEIKKDNFLVERILPAIADRDLYPDIVVSFRDKTKGEVLVFAVEVERNYKKVDRLVKKTRSLFMGNQLDGVIFACGETGIAESVRRGFYKNNPSKSLRIGRYSDKFLMFSSVDQCLNSQKIFLVGADGKVCSLDHWVNTLCNIPVYLRKNEDFEDASHRVLALG